MVNRVLSKYLIPVILVLAAMLWFQHRRVVRLVAERDSYEQNTTALLSEVKRFQLDSATMALDVRGLKLTVEEFKQFRRSDVEKIRLMGVKLQDLESAARHELTVDVPLDAELHDTIVIRDSGSAIVQRIDMKNAFIGMSGLIENDRLTGSLHIPVTLQQAIWIEYKRRWIFWKKAVAIHQIISSNNPYVEIRYSEYITIRKH